MGKHDEKAPKAATERRETAKSTKPDRVANLLRTAIEAFETKLKETDFKPTISEYLKLLQLERDLEQERAAPKEIRVTWIEPAFLTEK